DLQQTSQGASFSRPEELGATGMATTDTLVTSADQVNPMLTAEDIMTPSPRTCSNFSTVLEAVLIFRDADCGAVPVMEDGRPIGVLTDRDVALALAEYPDLPIRAVTDIMSRKVISVAPHDTLMTVKEKFGDRGV